MSKLSESQKQDINEMIAEKLGMDVEKIGNESKLEDDLEVDSLDIVELVMELEKMYDISIPDDDYDNKMTVQGLYEVVELYNQ